LGHGRGPADLRLAAAGLLLLAFALRVCRLNGQSFWFDESGSVVESRLPLGDVIAQHLGGDHPPGYFLRLRLWMRLAGESDYAVRFASVVAGTASLALLWRLGRRVAGREVAILALASATASSFGLYYGQEARSYALLGALTLLATYSYIRAMASRSPLRAALPPGRYQANLALPFGHVVKVGEQVLR